MGMTGRMTNWAGNITFGPEHLHRPSSVEELQHLVAGAGQLRVLGTGHSFNRIADSPGDLVSVADLPATVSVDAEAGSVTVAAGVRYGELATRLHAQGLALHNLASLPHISVAGACATGTHGSGDRNGSLSTAVSALEIVKADGELVTLSRQADRDGFPGAVVALGCLGVVTRLTLDVQPAFDVRQYVYDDLPGDAVDKNLEEILASAYSVSLFTDWSGPRFNQVWLKQRVGESPQPAGQPAGRPQPRWLGATLADGPRHPVPGMSAVNCTEQLGTAGPWHTRLPHFRLDFTPSSGEELQSEYIVPRDRAVEALHAVGEVRDRVAPVLQISEIRTIAADELWLSPSYRRDSVGIHFTWIKDTDAVAPAMAAVEDRLAPLAARPHWGKLFGVGPEAVTGRYERWSDFVELVHRFDPAGKFRNDMMRRYLPAPS
jgi:alditol oxidase